MNQACLVEQAQSVEQLLCEHADERRTKTAELVLLDQLVQVDTQQFKHETQMLSVDESILKPQEVVIVVLVHLLVQLFCCQHPACLPCALM